MSAEIAAKNSETESAISVVVLRVLCGSLGTQPLLAFHAVLVSKAVLTDCAGLRSERERSSSA